MGKKKTRGWSFWLKIAGGIFVTLLIFYLIGTLGEKDTTIDFYKTKNIELHKQLQTCQAKPAVVKIIQPPKLKEFKIAAKQEIFKIKDNKVQDCIDRMNKILRDTTRRYNSCESNRKRQVKYWRDQYYSWKAYARGLRVGC